MKSPRQQLKEHPENVPHKIAEEFVRVIERQQELLSDYQKDKNAIGKGLGLKGEAASTHFFQIRAISDLKNHLNQTALFEDNNGGEVLEITKIGKNQYRFKVGWQCVWFMGKTGTISEICEWLAGMEEILTKAGYECRKGL